MQKARPWWTPQQIACLTVPQAMGILSDRNADGTVTFGSVAEAEAFMQQKRNRHGVHTG